MNDIYMSKLIKVLDGIESKLVIIAYFMFLLTAFAGVALWHWGHP